jgi:hypothetical protein
MADIHDAKTLCVQLKMAEAAEHEDLGRAFRHLETSQATG